MHSITINFKDIIVYKHVKWFLDRFNNKEIEVIENNNEFEKVKKIISKDYEMMISKNTELISVDELDSNMEEIIKSYEN